MMIDESTPIEELKEDLNVEETHEKTVEDIQKEYDELMNKFNDLNDKYIKAVEKNNELFNRLTFSEKPKETVTETVLNILRGR